MFLFSVLSYVSMMMLATNQPIQPPVRSYYGDFLFDRGASDLGFIGGDGPYVPLPDDIEQGIECRPTINTSRKMSVDIESPRLDPWYVNNVSNPEWNKEGKTWTLVKENAPIPAWKVWAGGGRCDEGSGVRVCGEMEHVGVAIPPVSGAGGGANPDIGSEVYIGVGWCNPEDIEVPEPHTGSSSTGRYLRENGCLDPLTQDVLFVVTRKGALKEGPRSNFVTDHRWGRNEDDKPPKTRETLEEYYWTFNVYVNDEELPANPTYEDLPAWMKLQCPDGSDVNGRPRCEADSLCDCYLNPERERCRDVLPQAAYESFLANGPPIETDEIAYQAMASPETFTTADGNPRLVIRNDELDGIDRAIAADNGIVLEQNYISLGEVPGIDPEKDIPLGTAYLNHFNVWMRLDLQPNISTADHALILVPIGKEGPNFIFGPILQVVNPEEHNLQLGTFVPGLPLLNLELPTSLAYEWWTPSCKPALYLYPEQETDVSVSVHPEGLITHSIPHHGTHGWNVTAYPDGTIVNLDPSSDRDDPAIGNLISAPSTYSYLYYEAAIDKLEVPKDTGWIKTTDELLVFFTSVLPTLGLNEVESADFIEYWMPKLTEEGETTWYITLIEDEELERVEPLTISPVPDTSIRVRFYFENLAEVQDAKERAETVIAGHTEMALEIPGTDSQTQRDGFTLVDWGGILGNGSCGIGETSQ